MFRFLLAAAVLIAPAALAEEVSYDNCREIVSMTDYVLSAQSECDVSLDLEAAALYKQCYAMLSEAHTTIAREHAVMLVKETKAKVGGDFCAMLKQTFAPIIKP